MNKRFIGYENYSGDLQKHRNGVLISMATGEAAGYSLFNLKDRGEMFIVPGASIRRNDHRRTFKRQRFRGQPHKRQAANKHACIRKR